MTLRVIVVDDESVTASAHAEYIRSRSGFNVIGTAFNARGAIEAIRTSFTRHEPVDLVLLDINLPDRSGHEVAKFLRAEGLPVDLLMVTADRRAASLRTATLHGAFGYLVKPFRLEDLGRKLQEYAQYRQRAGTSGEWDQASIDRLFQRQCTTSTLDLPKGLSEDTLDDLSDLLSRAKDGLSAREISEQLGLSRVTARRYLEYLHESGRVDRRSRHGTPGRPELEYSWLS